MKWTPWLILCFVTSGQAQQLAEGASFSVYAKQVSLNAYSEWFSDATTTYNLSMTAPDLSEEWIMQDAAYGAVPVLGKNDGLFFETTDGELYVTSKDDGIYILGQTGYDPFNQGWDGIAEWTEAELLYPEEVTSDIVKKTKVISYPPEFALPVSLIDHVKNLRVRLVEERTVTFESLPAAQLLRDNRRRRVERYKKLVRRHFHIEALQDGNFKKILGEEDHASLGTLYEEHLILHDQDATFPYAEFIASDQYTIRWLKPRMPAVTNTADVTDALQIQPNPSFGISQALISVPRPGQYTVEIKSVFGRVLRSFDAKVQKSQQIRMSFADLKKGSYICSLVDSNGRTISSKKLVLLKP